MAGLCISVGRVDQRAAEAASAEAADHLAKHLPTHTAGSLYLIWNDDMLRYEKTTGEPFIGSCETASLNAPLLFDPGEGWECGINIDWAGRAVEAVSDQSGVGAALGRCGRVLQRP
jgi:hypothetical protein